MCNFVSNNHLCFKENKWKSLVFIHPEYFIPVVLFMVLQRICTNRTYVIYVKILSVRISSLWLWRLTRSMSYHLQIASQGDTPTLNKVTLEITATPV